MFSTVQAAPGVNASGQCNRLVGEQKVKTLAKKIVLDQIGDVERKCYTSLTDRERAKVFEAMAVERGTVVELQKERFNRGQIGMLVGWRQLVERIPFSAFFKTIRPVVAAWQDNNCDGDTSDVDYVFRIDFPYPQSNPDRLRSFSQHVGVDAMLVYYQLRYGGIDSWGDTTNSRVYTCLGGGGVDTTGGMQTVYDHLKMHDDN